MQCLVLEAKIRHHFYIVQMESVIRELEQFIMNTIKLSWHCYALAFKAPARIVVSQTMYYNIIYNIRIIL